MPASSEFSWAASAHYKPPVFQVYGTKRKAADEDMVSEAVIIDNANIAKRQCLGEVQSNQLFPIAQNTEFSQGQTLSIDQMQVGAQQGFQAESLTKVHPQLQQVHLIHAQRSPSPMPTPGRPTFPTHDIEGAIEYHHNSTQHKSNTLQDDYAQISATTDHIMDLNDEVYNMSSTSQAAQMAMDSDCVPDQSQYGGRYSDAMEQIVTGSSDSASTPSMVKCFCRPSWEGYMSSKPYVSDYY